jgi:phosphatidate cytidylyltransferase
MSPRMALESEIFRAYLAIVIGLLLLGGATLAVLRWIAKRNVHHAWQAFQGWLLMAPAVLAALFLGRVAGILFIIALATCGFWEYARATDLARDRAISGVVFVGILGMGGIALAIDPFLGLPGWYGMFMTLPVYVIAAILLVPIIRNRAAGQLQNVALAVLGFVYIGWMLGHLAFLVNSRHAYGYVLFLLFAVESNDVAAYCCGRLFGRHPLRGNISPKKTWEGSFGGLAVSLALPWLLWFSFPHFGALELILTGLIVGIGGQLGDLSISMIKRDVGLKDMGSAIPGHGGILDRIDSLIYVAPLFLHMVRFFHDLY